MNNPLTEQELIELGWCGDTAQRPILPDERQEAENIVTRLMPRAVAEIRRLRAVERRIDAMMPLFEEARDALPAITEMAAKLHNVRLDLADRMDAVGIPERWKEANHAND